MAWYCNSLVRERLTTTFVQIMQNLGTKSILCLWDPKFDVCLSRRPPPSIHPYGNTGSKVNFEVLVLLMIIYPLFQFLAISEGPSLFDAAFLVGCHSRDIEEVGNWRRGSFERVLPWKASINISNRILDHTSSTKGITCLSGRPKRFGRNRPRLFLLWQLGQESKGRKAARPERLQWTQE